MDDVDWSSTTLGSVTRWSASLPTALPAALDHQMPMLGAGEHVVIKPSEPAASQMMELGGADPVWRWSDSLSLIHI